MGSGNNYGSLLGLLPSDSSGNSRQNGTTVNSGTVSNTYDPTAKTALDTALTSNKYSKEAAISDATGAMQAAVKSSLEQGMQPIMSNDRAAGGYNNTATKQLQDDLTARSSAAGAKVILDNINSYSQANANNVGAATAAVNATKGTTSDSTSSTSGASQNQSGSKGGIGDMLNGGGPSGTVICTQLYLDGHLSQRVYNADNKYVRMHFSHATVNGYRLWAVPFVMLMRKNKIAYAIGKFFGVRWSKHCAAHMIHGVEKNITGELLNWFMVPICWVLGSIVPDVQYYKLWKNS